MTPVERLLFIEREARARWRRFTNLRHMTPAQVMALLPAQDPRYDQGEAGLTAILHEIPPRQRRSRRKGLSHLSEFNTRETEIVWECLTSKPDALLDTMRLVKGCPDKQTAAQTLQQAVITPFERQREHTAGTPQALFEDLVANALEQVHWDELVQAFMQIDLS